MGSPHRAVVAGLLVLVSVCGGAPTVWAHEDEPSYSYGEGMMRKLGRGIANVFTGPLEIIRVSQQVSAREGYFAGWTSGVFQGVWRTLVREAAGVYEVVTFFVEVPQGFGPLVKPEFVFLHSGWAPDEGTY